MTDLLVMRPTSAPSLVALLLTCSLGAVAQPGAALLASASQGVRPAVGATHHRSAAHRSAAHRAARPAGHQGTAGARTRPQAAARPVPVPTPMAAATAATGRPAPQLTSAPMLSPAPAAVLQQQALVQEPPQPATSGPADQWWMPEPARRVRPSATPSSTPSPSETPLPTTPPPTTPPPTTPPPPATSPTTGFGMFEDLQYLTGTALNARLDSYQATGVTWARFQLIWNSVQRNGPDFYDWGPYDALVAGLQARGIQPLAVLGTTPSWARPAGCTDLTCAPADPAAYARFAATAVARYHGALKGLELWNEPNSDTFFKPSPDVARYAALVKAAYPAVKAVDPTLVVVTGGLAPAIDEPKPGGGYYTLAPLGFLSTLYARGAGGSFDAVGWHPYVFPALPGTPDPGLAWYQMYGPTVSVRSLMAAHGDSAKTIWATEMGAHTDALAEGALTEQEQATTITTAMRLWAGYTWAGPMFMYQYRDRGTDAADRENFFGMTRYDGSAKPALAAFVQTVAAWKAGQL